ncbi:hypothetical protein [Ectobacillus funiculus]|uniref:Uncharacterized protein n=1 Tax=Ectobacillus funiculus TaxID=137993 RepID=A0ABV5WDW5_9BACI
MTIEMKIAQDELMLSGMQVPPITPVPVSAALVQETNPTTVYRRKKYKNKPIKKGLLIEENQIFS